MITGIYENCIGTSDRAATLKYWAEMGYRVVAEGHLGAEQAAALYGHSSTLHALRLQNGSSDDHGLLRVLEWEKPRNAGLEFTHPLTIGSRWFAQMVSDVFMVRDAFADDVAAGNPWLYTEPARAIIMTGSQSAGFYDRFRGVREMFVIGPHTRQAFFQRYGYTRPGYGTIEPTSPMGVSEGTHSSLVTADHSTALFYAEVFDLKLINPHQGGAKPESRQTLMMQEGETEFMLTGFESPFMIAGLFQVYTPLYPTENKLDRSQPGSLGLSLFTYRTDEIAALHNRVNISPATAVTAIQPNEFGEPSFGFIAPDGMYWVVVGERQD